mmetsp:Transcript_2996/g.4515  ORF Transcript_2996/g.4515 Transcript_2996/m.4515 type:complete len:352 (+) Transcript_2996:50-1105(+)
MARQHRILIFCMMLSIDFSPLQMPSVEAFPFSSFASRQPPQSQKVTAPNIISLYINPRAPCKETFAKPLPWETEEDCDESSLKYRLISRSDEQEKDLLKVSTLAKLAVAFSPTERRIHLSDIETVTLLMIDDDRVEIEAVVCDDDGCVTLFIPVDFPHSCRGLMGDSEEECVIENMEELQNVAEGRIVQLEECLGLENLERLHPEWQLQARRPTTQEVQERLPSWWIVPECADIPQTTSNELIQECSLIRSLLNSGDFDDEIKLLARDGLIYLENGGLYEIEKAVVADVGPAGFCLRARAFLKSELHSGVSENDRKRSIVELCWPFGGEPATDPKVLRSKVLGAVTAISAS